MSKLFHIAQCTSTNDEILQFFEKEKSPFGLYTLNQTHGRGQYGNTWQMPENQNIAYSFLIEKKDLKTPKHLLNFYTAILIREFIDKMSEKKTFIKWPNDIILGKKKICGFIIEEKNIFDKYFYILGIGINVLQDNFSHLPKASSIFLETGIGFDPHLLCQDFHRHLSENLLYKNPMDIIEKYNDFLFGKNQIFAFKKNDFIQNGIIKKVDEQGFIWIDLEHEGEKKFYHKQIEMLY